MIRQRFTGQGSHENLHPLAQGSQAVPTNGNNGIERLSCDAPAPCKRHFYGLQPDTKSHWRRQTPAFEPARC